MFRIYSTKMDEFVGKSKISKITMAWLGFTLWSMNYKMGQEDFMLIRIEHRYKNKRNASV